MPDDTANAAASPEPPPHVPSVFISYAAEDRVAARKLRDALAAAGLDVWYDENELSGGDAWDQKIRRQIRDCEYFLPVISASTEARKEGYFRREWRLATERTLDMADDVLFLLPVAIDDTSEAAARVPEKFLTVQWLRAPGGEPTPAFTALLERLRRGDHQIPPRPTRAPFAYHRTTAPFATPAGPAAGAGSTPPLLPGDDPRHDARIPPPMPPFPPVPEKGGFFHGIKFLAEVLWWALTAAWVVLMRLPRWARILVIVWLVLSVGAFRCSRPSDSGSSSPRSTQGRGAGGGEGQKKLRSAIERATQTDREGGGFALQSLDVGRIASELSHVFGEGFKEAAAAGKSLVIVSFARPNAERAGDKFAHNVFLSLYGRLALERRNEISVVPPLRAEASLEALQARAATLKTSFLLLADPVPDGADARITVKLFSTADAKIVWTESFPVLGSDSAAVAETISEQVSQRIPRKEPRRPKGPPPPPPSEPVR
jgi:hypothetical protein